jgi:hypothetical protein
MSVGTFNQRCGVLLVSAGLASVAVCQTNNFTYELRLNPVDPNVVSGGQFFVPPEGATIGFWVEGRARANSLGSGNSNYGVVRASTGPAGQTAAFISVVDSFGSTRLGRSVVTASGPGGFPLTGRMPLFRSTGPVDSATPSPWHSATLNGPGATAFPSNAGNQFGAFDLDGDRLYGFDCYVGPSRSGLNNPWLADFPITPEGQFSPWSRLYRVDVLVPDIGARPLVVNAQAYLQAGVRAANIGGDTWLMNLTAAVPASGSATAAPFSLNLITRPPIPPNFTLLAQVPWLGAGTSNNWYQLLQTNRGLNWEEARDEAIRRGGYLATVTSEAEHQFLLNNFLNRPGAFNVWRGPWLGGSRTSASGLPTEGWSWVTGEPWSFTRWGSGEPNGLQNNEGYLHYFEPSLGVREWNDTTLFSSGPVTSLLVEFDDCPGRSVISQQPQVPAVLSTGSPVQLVVTASNALGYQWRRNGVNVPGAIGPSYSFTASASNQGFYDCVIQDTCDGVTTSTVPVAVCSNIVSPRDPASLGRKFEQEIAWDNTTGRFIAFGGSRNNSLNDVSSETLSWNGASWELLSISGPSARFGMGLSEAPGGGVLLFGGRAPNGVVLNDTWLFRNGAWTQITTAPANTPLPRGGTELVFDPTLNRAVLFGGFGASPNFPTLGDTWIFDGTSWTQYVQTLGSTPSRRFGHVMAFDRNRNGIVMFGGFDTSRFADTWIFTNSGWQRLDITGPSGRFLGSLHWDAARNGLLMIGGSSETQPVTDSQWLLDGSGWISQPAGFVGGPIWTHNAASNARGEVIVAGGSTDAATANVRQETWFGPTAAVIGTQPPSELGFQTGSTSPLVIEVQAAGANLQYRWFLNGVPLVNGVQNGGAVIQGATGNQLIIQQPNTGITGDYYVEITGTCSGIPLRSRTTSVIEACGPADIGGPGASETPDRRLDNNDFVVFVRLFFDLDARADRGSAGAFPQADGQFDANDLIVYIQQFFEGCN